MQFMAACQVYASLLPRLGRGFGLSVQAENGRFPSGLQAHLLTWAKIKLHSTQVPIQLTCRYCSRYVQLASEKKSLPSDFLKKKEDKI